MLSASPLKCLGTDSLCWDAIMHFFSLPASDVKQDSKIAQCDHIIMYILISVKRRKRASFEWKEHFALSSADCLPNLGGPKIVHSTTTRITCRL